MSLLRHNVHANLIESHKAWYPQTPCHVRLAKETIAPVHAGKTEKTSSLKLLASTFATLAACGLLGQEILVNVGEDTTLGDGYMSEKLVQLLVVADGQLEMTGNDTRLLVVASSVAGQFKNFSSEVFQYGGEIDGGT